MHEERRRPYCPTRRRIMQFAMVLVVLLTQSGCWNNKDINHRAFPIVMGLSKRDDHSYKVILQIPEPGRENSRLRTVEGTGDTISEIVDGISANMESEVDLLHLKIILIDKSYAEENINEGISAFIRSNEISPKTMAVICDEPLEQFFRRINGYNQNQGALLFNFFSKDAGWNPQIVQTRIWELYRSIHSFTYDEAIPIVRSGSGTIIECLGSGILRDGKLVGRISNDETLLLNAFAGVSTRGKVEILDRATVQVLGDSVSHASRLRGGKPAFDSTITLKVGLLEIKGESTLPQIAREMEQVMTKRFRLLFEKLQANEADVLGLGQYFRNKLTRPQLEKWKEDYYPNVEFNIRFNVIIENEGNLKMLN